MMTTPTERLEIKKKLAECRVCAWLVTLDEKTRRDWAQAIANIRFGAGLIASEIAIDVQAAGYAGPDIGESSVDTHRRKAHR